MKKSAANTKISLVYARALFDAAKDNSNVDKILVELRKVIDLLKKDDESIYRVLVSPIVGSEDKIGLIHKIFSNDLEQLLLNFLDLLVAKSRVLSIMDIFEAYTTLVDEYNEVIKGEVRISKEPSVENKEKIVESIQNLISKKVVAEFVEDKDLVAGFSAKIGSYRLEYSFDSHLKQIEKKLIRG